LDDVAKLLDDENMVNKILQKIDLAGAAEDYQTLREKLLKQMEAKQKQQEILYQDRLENKISESLFLRMNNRLENRISEIKREIAQLDLRKSEFVTSEEKIAKLKNYITNNGITNEIVKIVINRIIVFDKGDNYLEEKWNLNLSQKEKRYIEFIWCGLN